MHVGNLAVEFWSLCRALVQNPNRTVGGEQVEGRCEEQCQRLKDEDVMRRSLDGWTRLFPEEGWRPAGFLRTESVSRFEAGEYLTLYPLT